jgi:hypothetical protein
MLKCLSMVTKSEIRDYFAKFGKQGGKTRAKNMTPEQRSEASRKASEARWARIDASLKKTEKNLAKMKADAPKMRELTHDILVRSKALEKRATTKAKQKKSPPPEE